MLRTLKTVMRQDKEKFNIPKSVQQAIPIQTIWKDGIFLVGKNKYAKTYRFTDINFEVASEEDKKAMFLDYTSILNFFDCGATTKLTIIIRRLNREELKEAVFIPMQEDGLDKYRKEVNDMLISHMLGHSKEIISADVYGDTAEIIEDCLYAIEPFMEEVLPESREEKYYDYSDLKEIDEAAEEYLMAA